MYFANVRLRVISVGMELGDAPDRETRRLSFHRARVHPRRLLAQITTTMSALSEELPSTDLITLTRYGHHTLERQTHLTLLEARPQ